MPSNQLVTLCEQIEKQNTDHFGKFYMYVSLLNTVAVRDKSFVDGLPKYPSIWGGEQQLTIGEIPVEFTEQLNVYVREFANIEPGWLNSLSALAQLYLRKGKVSDLIHIIDKMLSHLTAIHAPLAHNQRLYESVDFEGHKAALVSFIEQVSVSNQQLLSLVDGGVNVAISGAVILAGAVLVIAAVISVIPAIIGLGLILGGGIAAYHYTSQGMAQASQFEEQMSQLLVRLKDLSEDRDFMRDKNHNAFFAAAIKPLPYAAFTAGEQLLHDPSLKNHLVESRKSLDELCTQLSV